MFTGSKQAFGTSLLQLAALDDHPIGALLVGMVMNRRTRLPSASGPTP